jgi:lipopolysaccharide biosynthesis glycosyltransferase
MAERGGRTDAVHVACCFDRKMELPFLVLASALKRHLRSDRKVVLHAFHSDPISLDPVHFTGFNSARFELRLQQIENRFDGPAPWPSYLTAATLLRLQLPSVLKAVDKVIYLDSDLIVLKDIAELYDTDLSALPLAACLDFWLTCAPAPAPPGWVAEEWLKFLSEAVGLADTKAYFNAGVMVMDLARLRSTNLMRAAQAFLEQKNYRTMYVDQDALNHAINGAFVRLDPRWNVLGSRSPTDLGDTADLINAAPWILHFAGPNKPWSCDKRRITTWHRRFWEEAAESAVLPLLLEAYPQARDGRGLAELESAGVLKKAE